MELQGETTAAGLQAALKCSSERHTKETARRSFGKGVKTENTGRQTSAQSEKIRKSKERAGTLFIRGWINHLLFITPSNDLVRKQEAHFRLEETEKEGMTDSNVFLNTHTG